MELRRADHRPDLHLRRRQRSGRAGRGVASRPRSTTTSCRSRTRSPTSTNALIANQKLQEQAAAQARLVAALQDYSRLATLQYNGGYTSYTTVLQAEQSLFPPSSRWLRCVRRFSILASASTKRWAAAGSHIADKATTGGTAVGPAYRRAAATATAVLKLALPASRRKFGGGELAAKDRRASRTMRVLSPAASASGLRLDSATRCFSSVCQTGTPE